MRDLFINYLLERAEKDNRIILVTGDLGYGVLKNFWLKLPNQIINVGIAEQNMIGFASGLAKQGYIPFVYSIGNFSSLRPIEQIRNDALYHNLSVKIISIGEGYSYGSLGMSHHATEDAVILSSFPDLSVITPSIQDDIKDTIDYCISHEGVQYIRLGRNTEINFNSVLKIEPFLNQIVKGNSFNAIITYGGILEEVLLAVDTYKLTNQDIPSVFTLSKSIDYSNFDFNFIDGYKNLVFVEEQNFPALLFRDFAVKKINNNPHTKFHSISINRVITSLVGDTRFLRSENEISSSFILKTLFSLK